MSQQEILSEIKEQKIKGFGGGGEPDSSLAVYSNLIKFFSNTEKEGLLSNVIVDHWCLSCTSEHPRRDQNVKNRDACSFTP